MPNKNPQTTATPAATAAQRGMIAASIPGRLRLRNARLRQAATGRCLAESLQAIDGVLSVEARPESCSLLLRYDSARCQRTAMEAAALAAVGRVFPDAPDVSDGRTAAPRPAGSSRRQRSRDWNRVAKLGMLASLPLSLALAAAGAKKLHIVSGGAFTLLLLVHLLVHRRHLTQ